MSKRKKETNSQFLLKDLIQGDSSIDDRFDYKDLSPKDIKKAFNAIISNPHLSEKEKQFYLLNSWRIHFNYKPPTIKEFLTSEYLGASALYLHDHVRETLEDYWSPDKKYNQLFLSSCIGWGKSLCSIISISYLMTHLYLMKNCKQYLGVNPITHIVTALISFTEKKAKELLLKPFLNFLQESPKFRRVKQEDRLKDAQIETPNKIVWTSASSFEGSIQFANDTHIIVMSKRSNLLGLTMISAVLSELSFFLDKGVSAEEIWRTYQDTSNRMASRFGNNYYANIVIDSSPNTYTSPIDKFIFSGEIDKYENIKCVRASHWDTFPDVDLYNKWRETGETFPVFKGSNGKPPKIILQNEIEKYAFDDIIQVPIDLKVNFENDLSKMIKDYAGFPSGSDDKLISNYDLIDASFYPQLKNIMGYIKSPFTSNPEKLIWNQIKDEFFIYFNGIYEFYRYPQVPRFIHIDQSEVNDLTSIVCVHMEVDEKGRNVIVVDFTIVISSGNSKINLDANRHFIYDLIHDGRLNLKKITADRYQSAAMIQSFKRNNLNSDHFSVDREIEPYRIVISWLLNRRIKSGKNIFLKNNWKSLIEIRHAKGIKIDHIKSSSSTILDDGLGWNKSISGFGAKDVTDGLVGAAYQCIEFWKQNGVPSKQWVDKIKKTKKNEQIIKKIENQFGLQIVS